MSADPHPPSAEVASLTATELLVRLRSGETTSLEVVDALLERIAAVDSRGPSLGSVAAVGPNVRDTARERDLQRSRGEILGPLHGLPVLIKDNIEATGLPGCAGSTALVERATRDAALVARLRGAGAIILGSTNLSQWANIRSPNSASGYSASGGLVGNPWALDRSAGGSSSGSGAAVAAGLAPLAVGTETDGSITCPASLNGVYGLKPTVGTVPTGGVVPISHSQDSPGPMARSLDDLRLALGVLAARGPEPTTTPRFVVATSWRSAHGGTDALFDAVVSELRDVGGSVAERDASLPSSVEYDDELTVMLCELLDDMDAYLADRNAEGVRSLADVVAFEDEHADVELRYFGHEFFTRAVLSGGCASEAYRVARPRNRGWAEDVALGPLIDGHDVILAPAYGPSWKSDLVNGDSAKFVSASIMAAAIAGWPILTIPMGVVEGLPVGLTLVGRPHSEWLLLDAASMVDVVIRRRGDPRVPAWLTASRG